MSDPYSRQFVTAGNPYVAADGTPFSQVPLENQGPFINTYGATDAPIVWAQYTNQILLSRGQALLTPEGVVSMQGVLTQLQEHGYTGPTDPSSIAQNYKLLKTPPPPTPAPAGTVSASGALSLPGLGSLPMPVVVGGGLLLLFMLGGRRR